MAKNKEMLQQQCDEIIEALTALKEDDGVPKNVRAKIDTIISELKADCELSLKVGKSLHNLDEVSEDMNLPAFIRTQIWNISSMLEKLNQ
ncbi:MAG TPA: UPF0147 family protein [Alphaproteobacteria bacterium]|nr:UPF0147 family protein [Alphaproteobacteria bacterium]